MYFSKCREKSVEDQKKFLAVPLTEFILQGSLTYYFKFYVLIVSLGL